MLYSMGVNTWDNGITKVVIPEQSSQEQLKFDELALAELDEIVSICKENDIDIIFFTNPYVGVYQYSEAMIEYARKNGYQYFNLFELMDEVGINEETDFNDSGHLNVAGATKVADYITLVKKKTAHFEIKMCILLLMIASTLRSKAFGAVILYMVIYFCVFLRKKKINAMTVVATSFAGLLIAWTQIQYYFFSNIKDDSARNVLLLKCFKIAKDHFPLGAGFGTYASYYSGKHYSPLYLLYSLSFVHGLKSDDFVFVSDSFWPMIIGQNGYLGFVCYIVALLYLLQKITPYFKINREYYAAAFFALGYLGISSLAESAFVNSFAIPFAMVIGMIIYRKESEVK